MAHIEILNEDSSRCSGYKIWHKEKSKHLSNLKGSFPKREFSEEDILDLIGIKEYNKFEEGKYEFIVTNKSLFKLTEDYSFFHPSFLLDHELLNRK